MLALVALVAWNGCGPSSCSEAPVTSEAPSAASERPPETVKEAVRRVEAAPTPEARREAIQDIDEVAAVDDKDAFRVLEEALKSGDESVAEAAIDTLELMETDAAADALGGVLERSSNKDLKLRSLDALSSFGGERAARAAVIGLDDHDPEVREAAVDTVLMIDNPYAVDSLWQAERAEQDEWIRDLMLDALESLGEDTERYRDE